MREDDYKTKTSRDLYYLMRRDYHPKNCESNECYDKVRDEYNEREEAGIVNCPVLVNVRHNMEVCKWLRDNVGEFAIDWDTRKLHMSDKRASLFVKDRDTAIMLKLSLDSK